MVQSASFLRFFEFTRHTHRPGRPAGHGPGGTQPQCSVSSSSGSILLRRIRNEAYLETRPSGLTADSIDQTQFSFSSFLFLSKEALQPMRCELDDWCYYVGTSRLGRWRWFLVETFRRRQPMPLGDGGSPRSSGIEFEHFSHHRHTCQ